MNKSEIMVEEIYEKLGFDVVHTNPHNNERGYPDFKVFNFETKERFYIEVKTQNQMFSLDQIKKFQKLIGKNFKVFLATVFPDKIKISLLDENLNEKEIEEIKLQLPKNRYLIKCKRCGYLWSAIVKTPKQCPRCKRYDYSK